MDEQLVKADQLRDAVRRRYGAIAEGGTAAPVDDVARAVGYSEGDLRVAPEGANLGLGCGNPTALAQLRPGDVVLDLGSGAGFDAFLAVRAVGPAGRVIGVDMTPAMVAKAQENARAAGVTNAEFRLGTIEELPVEGASVDVVISNCVINLSPDKPRVFREAFRVLKPGGRLLVSDIVWRTLPPEPVRASVEAFVGCIAGAALKGDYLRAIADAGFGDVRVVRETDASALLGEACACAPDPVAAEVIAAVGDGDDLRRLVASVASIAVSASKP
ncbi:MAG: arsenite methyltransferase [Deltaproteobacteria bacterium]|nr:arsenite methyltransferase [Deltaproteobacteria bacterium]